MGWQDASLLATADVMSCITAGGTTREGGGQESQEGGDAVAFLEMKRCMQAQRTLNLPAAACLLVPPLRIQRAWAGSTTPTLFSFIYPLP